MEWTDHAKQTPTSALHMSCCQMIIPPIHAGLLVEPSWPSQPDLRLFCRPPRVATHRFAASFLALLEPLALVPTVLLLESELLDSNHHFQQSHHLRKVPGSLFLQTFYIACTHRFGCSVFHRASPQIYHQLADTIRPLELQKISRSSSPLQSHLGWSLMRLRSPCSFQHLWKLLWAISLLPFFTVTANVTPSDRLANLILQYFCTAFVK